MCDESGESEAEKGSSDEAADGGDTELVDGPVEEEVDVAVEFGEDVINVLPAFVVELDGDGGWCCWEGSAGAV